MVLPQKILSLTKPKTLYFLNTTILHGTQFTYISSVLSITHLLVPCSASVRKDSQNKIAIWLKRPYMNNECRYVLAGS